LSGALQATVGADCPLRERLLDAAGPEAEEEIDRPRFAAYN